MLGLCCYLTFSRGALGATAAGLAVLVALAPTRERLRAAVIVAVAAALPAAATVALPAVKAPGGSAGQGAAMLALLVVVGAAAAWLTARGERASVPVRGVRVAALTCLALAVGVTAYAATRAERHGGNAVTGASASRLVSAQSNRYEYWRVAVRAFRREPLRGDGSGSFRTDWLRERPFAESVRDAHSLYLETAAELGLVGLAALGVFLGGVAASARNALRREDAAGAVAALVVWAVHAGLDWDWEMPALTLVALVLAARLAPGDAAPAPSPAAPPAAS